MVVALGLAVPLFFSGLVEAFVTPAPVPLVVKLLLGGAVWLSFLLYVGILGWKAVRANESSDVAPYERESLAPTV